MVHALLCVLGGHPKAIKEHCRLFFGVKRETVD